MTAAPTPDQEVWNERTRRLIDAGGLALIQTEPTLLPRDEIETIQPSELVAAVLLAASEYGVHRWEDVVADAVAVVTTVLTRTGVYDGDDDIDADDARNDDDAQKNAFEEDEDKAFVAFDLDHLTQVIHRPLCTRCRPHLAVLAEHG